MTIITDHKEPDRSAKDADRNDILACLQQYADDDVCLVSELELLLEDKGKEAYTVLFHILTNLDFSRDEAEEVWHKIVNHWEALSAKLGRKISIRTAVCDYFCSVNKALHNPKVIEIHLFEKTDKQSKYDNLTNLFNRNYFDDILERELARAVRHGTTLSLLLLDLDDFKSVNDAHGHLVGDQMLRHVAAIIMEEKRTEDIATRFGGEELTVILPETDKINGLVLAERIRYKMEETPLIHHGQKIPLTLSGGVASFPQDATRLEDLISKTDSALYQAKASGKNTICAYSGARRRYLRIDFDKEIKLEVLGLEPSVSLEVHGKNLSSGGLLFESSVPFDLGTNIRLTIPINPEQPLTVSGSVVRIESYGPDIFDIGISFLRTQRSPSDEICEYILQQLQKSPGRPAEI